jgi:predicted branched-subunit amino acid permease
MRAGRVVLRQSNANALGLPILIAVVLVAIVVSQLFARRPSTAVFVGCAAVAVLDVFFGWYFFREGGSTLVITA